MAAPTQIYVQADDAKLFQIDLGQRTVKVLPGRKPIRSMSILLRPPRPSNPIYAFEGDELKIRFAQAGETGPTEFKTEEGTSTQLLVLKRAKK